MSRSFWVGAFAVCAGLASVGCGPELTDVYMAEDQRGKTKTRTFREEGQKIFLILRLSGGNEDTILTITMEGPDGILLEEDEIFPHPNSESSGAVDVGVQLVQIGPNGEKVEKGPWPTGDYTIEVDLDDEFEGRTDFKIESL